MSAEKKRFCFITHDDDDPGGNDEHLKRGGGGRKKEKEIAPSFSDRSIKHGLHNIEKKRERIESLYIKFQKNKK